MQEILKYLLVVREQNQNLSNFLVISKGCPQVPSIDLIINISDEFLQPLKSAKAFNHSWNGYLASMKYLRVSESLKITKLSHILTQVSFQKEMMRAKKYKVK
jgi:hypothetical protein